MTFSPEHGTCRCGAVEIEVSAPPFMTMACHCRGCQRMTSSAFSLTMMVPAAALRVTRGETVRGGIGGPMGDHRFCDRCKSWLFTRFEGQDFVNVRPTMFDRPDWSRPFAEVQTAEKLDWVQLPVRHSFERFPPPEQYGPLIAEFTGG